jgi:hypothetical protein
LYTLTRCDGFGVPSQLATINPAIPILLVVGILVGGTILSVGGQILTARLVTPQTLGQAAIVQTLANHIVQLAIPVICLGMMLSLRRQAHATVG